ncbi:LOW QUALITY PROTEIN: hypothetical protein PHMEG_00024344 [Phytophthora megakarya]|uniref:Reverse transcriptase n=1 Tax=Phytophthora megakarya TaxID=4795 RepID=A0A225VER1_9STRA|nr:LOW QUALITY PROTEIN: hypothetical protein PHMEG_00024344 [Phytophthora megakarya]
MESTHGGKTDLYPKDHPEESRIVSMLHAVTKSLRDGQESGQYMIVDANLLDQWPDVVCSLLGVVEKKGTDPSEEVRTIHGLSFPKDCSVNDAFATESVPKVRYESVSNCVDAGHIGRIRILKGDVKGAFRHLRTQENQVFHMADYIPKLGIVIIDMATPFGWSGSPPCYALFGRAISWLMASNSPATVSGSLDHESFSSYEWVDNQIFVEQDVDDHLELTEATLRHAMLTVLGPRSINESNFSGGKSKLVALGLSWNTVQ